MVDDTRIDGGCRGAGNDPSDQGDWSRDSPQGVADDTRCAAASELTLLAAGLTLLAAGADEEDPRVSAPVSRFAFMVYFFGVTV